MRAHFAIAMAVALLAVSAAAGFAPAPSASLPQDFSANVTVNMSGEVLHGFMYHDTTGQRSYVYLQELSQYVFTFQPFGMASLTAYTLTTSGCTCQITPGGTIGSFFAEYPTAKKVGTCAGGTMYKNVDFPNLGAAPHRAFCMGSDGSPIAAGHTDGTWYTFSSFTAGRDKAFPTEPLLHNIDACNQACL